MELSTEQNHSKRLIVLIPGSLANNTNLAHKIYWMADRENLAVLYLTLVDNDENTLAVSRCMATMKAVTSANKLSVESKLTETGNWLKVLREVSHPGDTIVCPEEQTVLVGFFRTIPVSDFLSDQLDTPVLTISGFYNPYQTQVKKWFHEFFSFTGFLAIMAFFTWSQIRLGQTSLGSQNTLLVMVTFLIEIGAIWAWNWFTHK
jgi:hypothetical protein